MRKPALCLSKTKMQILLAVIVEQNKDADFLSCHSAADHMTLSHTLCRGLNELSMEKSNVIRAEA